MTLARTGVMLVVEGATAAESELRKVHAAEKAIGTAAPTGVKALEGALEKVTGPAGKALRVFNDIGDVFRLTAAGLAGGALFGGLQDIAEGFGALADAVGLTKSRIDAMVESGRTLDAGLVARAKGVDDLAGAMDRYAASIGVAAGKQLTFLQRQDALRKVAAGEVSSLEIEERRAEDTAKALDRARIRLAEWERRTPGQFMTEIQRAGGERAFGSGLREEVARLEKLQVDIDRTQRGMLGQPGANPWVESVREFGGALVTRVKIAGRAAIDEMENDLRTFGAVVESQYELAQRKGREVRAARGARTGGPSAPTFDQLAAFGPRAQALSDRRAFSRMDAEMAERAAAERSQAAAAVAGQAEFGKHALAEPDTFAENMRQLADTSRDVFAGMASHATDAAGIMVNAIGTVTGALGSMVTNLIIAGDAGSKGLGKVVGNALAGLSAQAFGYSILLGGLAAAAALSGPILGWGAPGLAAAAGIMAGTGTALAIGARALGADKIGGGGGSARGGGAGNPAAGTNPFSVGGQSAPVVTVIIGGEVVTRGVKVETRRQEMRGGAAEGRMARAS